MPTILADSFTASLAKLANDEQKQAKLTAFDLQTNPDQPGLQFHRIDKSKDPNFWSVRVNRDIRIIVHKTGASLMLVYVDHHDDAYKWAERRRIDTHPTTGAVQIVEVRELVEEIAPAGSAPAQTELALDLPAPPPPPAPRLFDRLADADLLSVGVPGRGAARICSDGNPSSRRRSRRRPDGPSRHDAALPRAGGAGGVAGRARCRRSRNGPSSCIRSSAMS